MTAPSDPFRGPDPLSRLPRPPRAGTAARPSPEQWRATIGASAHGFAASPQSVHGAPGAGAGGPDFAGWGQRVGASIIDTLIAIFAGSFAAALLSAVLSEEAAIALGYVVSSAVVIWQLVAQGRTGQTPGKKVVGIRLARWQDGQDVGAGRSIGRAALHVVDALPLYLGFLWPLWDRKRQTFADKIVNTVVVRA